MHFTSSLVPHPQLNLVISIDNLIVINVKHPSLLLKMSILRAENNTLNLDSDLDSEREWKEGFTFIQAADCQLGMSVSYR